MVRILSCRGAAIWRLLVYLMSLVVVAIAESADMKIIATTLASVPCLLISLGSGLCYAFDLSHDVAITF
jgi:hypothetical protein